MNLFPVLRTGAVAQYPAQRGTAFATEVIRFVDGSEQRSRAYRGSTRFWLIRLDQLDEGELADIDEFFIDQNGSLGTFAFTDPWDGSVYPDCSLAVDEVNVRWEGPGSGRTEMVIRENRP